MKPLFAKRKIGQYQSKPDTVSILRCLPAEHPDYGKDGRTLYLHNSDLDLRVIMDDGDFELVADDIWNAKMVDGVFYAWSNKHGWMHEYIFLVGKNQFLYHRDGNGLDNRSKNIFLSFTNRMWTTKLHRKAKNAPISGSLDLPYCYESRQLSPTWKARMSATGTCS